MIILISLSCKTSYGEQGSIIIHQTLFNLFPPSSFDVSFVSPLTPAEFIQRVLVPEAATRLIAQDLNSSVEEALVTLRESVQYGVAMFPDTDSKRAVVDEDDGEMGVADKIVMERARARRKELEVEERLEKEMVEEAARKAKTKKEKASKGSKDTRKANTEVVTAESDSCQSEASAWSQRTKPRPRIKQRTAARDAPAQDEESDAISVESEWSIRPSTKATKASVQGKRSHPPSHTAFDDVDAMEIVDITTPKHTNFTKLKRPIGAASSSLYPVDGEDESTPRPQKHTAANVLMRPGQSSRSDVPLHPLQIARNRTQTRWVTRNLRTYHLVVC